MTPEEKFNGTKIDVRHLKIFGCSAYYLMPKQNWRKRFKKGERDTVITIRDAEVIEEKNGYEILSIDDNNYYNYALVKYDLKENDTDINVSEAQHGQETRKKLGNLQVYVDNQAAMKLSNNSIYHSRTKHIQRKYFS
ncbi:hypothetical protein HHI36_008989 [Cryptolaemus montrouzieri]|uniref:Uncharacterized protein n=1 Tax=Cryptolaemus montrouzieri TaxID=559131 RepID=A0ABD2MUG7_9CUCU